MFKIINKIRRLFFNVDNFGELVKYIVKSEMLLQRTMTVSESVINKDHNSEYVVSLTTYGRRIHDVHLVIESIGLQTIKASRVVLWLDEKEFDMENLPVLLHKQVERGLEIKFCPNYKSYKKFIPSFRLFPDANIITIDDDILYPVDMIEQLIREHKLYPQCIIGQRAHKIKVTKNNVIRPYLKWELETKDSKPGNDIFLTTGAGTLFPKKCFSSEVADPGMFLALCPTADDVWFKVMAVLNGVKCKAVNDEREFLSRFMFIPDSQDMGLSHVNVHQNMNDVQLKGTLKHYSLNIDF
ncbi:MAG: glycosyl transferase [Paraglaciecola sp.]|nr:glycosyl transferase [Paraglaciecola sp.]